MKTRAEMTLLLEFLEEIEELTGEIHRRTLGEDPRYAVIAHEAARLAHEAERLVARLGPGDAPPLKPVGSRARKLRSILDDLRLPQPEDASVVPGVARDRLRRGGFSARG